MDNSEYEEWKSHRLTKKFHKYLTDFRQNLMERWAGGSIVDPQSQLMAMARCQLLDEIVTLDDDTISEFYRQQPKGSDDVPND